MICMDAELKGDEVWEKRPLKQEQVLLSPSIFFFFLPFTLNLLASPHSIGIPSSSLIHDTHTHNKVLTEQSRISKASGNLKVRPRGLFQNSSPLSNRYSCPSLSYYTLLRKQSAKLCECVCLSWSLFTRNSSKVLRTLLRNTWNSFPPPPPEDGIGD